MVDKMARCGIGSLPMRTRHSGTVSRHIRETTRSGSSLIDIGVGLPGIQRILAVLNKMAQDYRVNPLVREVAEPYGSHDPATTGKNMLGWYAGASHWVADPLDSDWFKTPEKVLENYMVSGRITGDCDDLSTTLCALFLSIGIPCEIVAVFLKPTSDFYDHVITRWFDGETWKQYDPSHPGKQFSHYMGHV